LPDDVQGLYRHRFGDAEAPRRVALWRVLCDHVFMRYVRPADTVLDLAAGRCEFINQIRCGTRIAVDWNPDLARHAAPNVRVVRALSTDMAEVESASVDVVFISNFLEHLPDTTALVGTLAEVRRVLRPGGLVIILQPNIRLVGGAYWDFVDHHLPLTEKSLVEALENAGFAVREVRARFLPYTTKGRLPTSALLARLYLMLPPAQWLLGKQSLVVAARAG
jgi:SAM-dependent methyltransferase